MKTIVELVQNGQMLQINGKTYKAIFAIETSVSTLLRVVSMTDNGKKYESLIFPLGTEIIAY